ncbi:MAG: winged helix-turn-helix transcriptional regulator, partial [Thermoplasmatota archaeon]
AGQALSPLEAAVPAALPAPAPLPAPASSASPSPAPSPSPNGAPNAAPDAPLEPTPVRRRSLLARLLASFAGLALGWRRVSPKTALAHESRAAMLARLRERPGAHLRALARELGLSPQNASYHLRQLETCGLVGSSVVGRRRVFYPKEGGQRMRVAAEVNGVLGSPERARLLAAVVDAPGIHEGALARSLALAHGSVSWGARQLVKAGFLTPAPEGNRVRYFATAEGSAALASVRSASLGSPFEARAGSVS